MTDDTALARAFRWQIAGCAAFGSAFSAALLERALADAQAGGSTAPFLAPWAAEGMRKWVTDAVVLRLLGAFHDLALSGEAPALACAYPAADRAGNADDAWRAALAAMDEHQARIAAFMTHEPQTNEVRRSACLLGGFLTLARETALPLRCFEAGASAGLNQLWDCYRYDLGRGLTWGDPTSLVVIDAEWRGSPPPLNAAVSVIERAACDRAPVDIHDPNARRRLRAYVWPDQLDRLTRLDAALALALAAGTTPEAADAVAWTRARAAPKAGAATVMFHSVFWQYMPAESQAALTSAIHAHGAAASQSAPFAWLRMEPPPDNMAIMEVRLTLWPGGEERVLARVHPHGAWAEWSGNILSVSA